MTAASIWLDSGFRVYGKGASQNELVVEGFRVESGLRVEAGRVAFLFFG